MDIRNTRAMKHFAAERLAGAPMEKKIVLIYSALTLGTALLGVALQYALGLQIDQMGGLSQIGTRTILSTIQSMLPLVQSVVAMCLEIGYVAAMLRIARGQYSLPNTLRLGFARFWALMRCTVIQGLVYAGLLIAAVYLASMIFVSSPWGEPFQAVLDTLTGGTSLMNPQVALDDAAITQLLPTMVPMVILTVILTCLFVIPVSYRFRMANYVIIDKPAVGAMAALRESRKMMRGKCLKLLKLDLSYWWYALLTAVAACVGNLDRWLLAAGITLPVSEEVAYFGFYAVYLALLLALYYFLRNRVEVTYSLFYDGVKPEEKQDNAVVLGNIFQM